MHLSFKRTPLWHQPNFIKLWVGQTISLFGSAITTLALPLTAISLLHASAQQMGFLFALSQMPPLLFGLIVGAVLCHKGLPLCHRNVTSTICFKRSIHASIKHHSF